MNFADRLLARSASVGSAVCVGIDPRVQYLPAAMREKIESSGDPAVAAADAFAELGEAVVAATAPYACAFKPQSAFFEALGPAGSGSLARVIAACRRADVPCILDAKRGDIGSTSEAYAQAAFGGLTVGQTRLSGYDADALTVNPYLGTDGVAPFVEAARTEDRGLFILVRTSNPSAREVQHLDASSAPVWKHVAGLVARWGETTIGERGYSSVGAVAGATDRADLASVRQALPNALLLVPGYGAQGGGAEDVVPAFDGDGLGAVVNASRSIVFADREAEDLDALVRAAVDAASQMREAIASALAARS